MGILDLFSQARDDVDLVVRGRVKGPCATLLDHGIDPAELKFTLGEDGSVTVSGRARDANESHRICQVIGDMPLVESVRNHMRVCGAAKPGARQAAGNVFKQAG